MSSYIKYINDRSISCSKVINQQKKSIPRLFFVNSDYISVIYTILKKHNKDHSSAELIKKYITRIEIIKDKEKSLVHEKFNESYSSVYYSIKGPFPDVTYEADFPKYLSTATQLNVIF